ncbi:MAG: response regulator transcription factor [Bdellovibrionota bacterium]
MKKKRILLVEDSEYFQVLTKKVLGSDFEVVCVFQAADALKEVEKTKFDLILLDVMLPDGDGFLLCAQLKNAKKCAHTPIIFITAKTGVTEKVTGFSLGAEDYIVKPFEPLELRARVESKLKSGALHRISGESANESPIELNEEAKHAVVRIRQKTRTLDLTPTEFSILGFFLKHQDRVISREELGQFLWKSVDEAAGGRTLDRHISFLRRKLLSQSHCIQTVSGSGYRFSVNGVRRRKAA